jgi:ABC-type transport system involved in cytochrome c biogenesis permease subunit
MSLILGLLLLTIGTFLGGVWANESWGRYWGWDPKETWALISMLIYAIVIHSRFIPVLKNIYAFNLLSLLSISSVIMTYFGVNFYLSGLHSYASGDPVPIPVFVYYSLTVIVLLAILSYYKYKKFSTSNK